MTTAITSTDQLIQQLKQDWDRLSDLGRARAIDQIRRSGLSNRDIGRKLARGETTIRRLLHILRAPAADIAAAQSGSISTNELIRRTDAALLEQAAQRKTNVQRLQKQQAIDGARIIYDWIEKLNVSGAYGEQIVDEGRRIMIDAFHAGTLPHVDPPPHPVPPQLIIERCKPKEPLTDDVDPSGWYSKWLARWIVFVFTDPDVRDQALDIAIEQQRKR